MYKIEKRNNWKENLGKAARQRQQERHDLLLQMEQVRAALQNCGSNFALYDDLKAKQRGIIARLAKLHF